MPYISQNNVPRGPRGPRGLPGVDAVAVVPTPTNIPGLTEYIQDAVNAMIVAGANVTKFYDDTAGTLTITATGGTGGGGGTDTEVVRDTVFAALRGINGVTVSQDDPADTITLSISGLSISQVTGLTAALDAKAPTASPTFTGTVSGVTKGHVGLGNVDNTSDANKPISAATNTALTGKVDGLGGVKAVRYADTLPAWTPADEGTLIFVPSA